MFKVGMALIPQPGCHRVETGMTTSALDARVFEQLRDVGLQRVTGHIVDLLAVAVDSAFAVHRVLVALEC